MKEEIRDREGSGGIDRFTVMSAKGGWAVCVRTHCHIKFTSYTVQLVDLNTGEIQEARERRISATKLLPLQEDGEMSFSSEKLRSAVIRRADVTNILVGVPSIGLDARFILHSRKGQAFSNRASGSKKRNDIAVCSTDCFLKVDGFIRIGEKRTDFDDDSDVVAVSQQIRGKTEKEVRAAKLCLCSPDAGFCIPYSAKGVVFLKEQVRIIDKVSIGKTAESSVLVSNPDGRLNLRVGLYSGSNEKKQAAGRYEFGRFSGVLTLDDGTAISFDEAAGFMQKD